MIPFAVLSPSVLYPGYTLYDYAVSFYRLCDNRGSYKSMRIGQELAKGTDMSSDQPGNNNSNDGSRTVNISDTSAIRRIDLATIFPSKGDPRRPLSGWGAPCCMQ